MKVTHLFWGSCFLAGLALAHDLGQITSKRTQVAEKELTIERTFRGEACVMFEMTRSNRTTTAFLINDQVVAVESDEDGDGFKESFTIFDPATREFERYIRHTNGVVVPIDSDQLAEIKLKAAAADESLSNILRTNRTK